MHPARHTWGRSCGRTIASSALAVLGCALLSCTRAGAPAPAAPEAGAASPQPARTERRPAEVALVPPDGGARTLVRVELARSPAEHEHGLMYRRDLPEGTGMLFLFDRPEIRRFWMKNTYVSLDMLFLDEHRRVVGIEANTTPLDETPRGPDAPAQYVLEVPAGYCQRHRITVGTQADFLHVN